MLSLFAPVRILLEHKSGRQIPKACMKGERHPYISSSGGGLQLSAGELLSPTACASLAASTGLRGALEANWHKPCTTASASRAEKY
jgi:hypothetical protein